MRGVNIGDRRSGGALRVGLTTFVVVLVSISAAACGDSSDSPSSAELVEGGELTIAQTSTPDYLDPALSYTVNGWEPMWVVYTPLLTYRHEEGDAGSEIIPGLAENLPESTDGGKTYTLTLRKTASSSPTARRLSPATSSTRSSVSSTSSPAERPYYQPIVGAEGIHRRPETLRPTSPGIVTNNQTGEIEIKLVEPNEDPSSYSADAALLRAWFRATLRSAT